MAKGRGCFGTIIVSLLLLGGVAAAGWWWWQNLFPIKGIDVSRYQTQINWDQVKRSGIRFAFIKATEGIEMVDPYFGVNWDEAKEIGIARGAYHFFKPAMDGTTQANHFLKHLHLENGDLPPVLDLEAIDNVGAVAIRREALEWLQTVEEATGMKPIVYTLPHYAKNFLDGKLSRYPLWVVDLGLWPWPSESPGWKKWTFWQHSHHGSLSGIDGDVDLNFFNGSEGEFQKLLR